MVVPVVAVVLAFYGWFLVVQLAKRRESHDLYCSVISLLEQLEVNAERAWAGAPACLDEYTERKLLSKIAAVEQRYGLIKWYYKNPEEPASITPEKIGEFHLFITLDAGALSRIRPSEDRNVAIHRLTATMVQYLLEEDYAYINRHLWLPLWLYRLWLRACTLLTRWCRR